MKWLEPDPYHPGTILLELEVKPCPAPRQSRKDKHHPSEAVQRYRVFRDICAFEWSLTRLEFPAAGAAVSFWLAMPASWPKRKKADMQCHPHTGKPDLDNLCKAFLDALFRDCNDSHIYDIHLSKFWHPGDGCIRIEIPRTP